MEDFNFQNFLQKLYNATFNSPNFMYWWLGLLGVLLALFIIWRFRRAHRNFRVFRDESGVAETTNNALRDLVRIACDGVETASKPRIHFVKKHGRINVSIKAKLYQGQRLGEVRDQMRRRVTNIFQDTHGILVGDVSFTATGFKKSNKVDAEPILQPEPTPSVEPVVKAEPAKKVEPVKASEPEKKAEPEKKSTFGWSEPKAPKNEPVKDSKSEPAKEIDSTLVKDKQAEPTETKRKGGLFGGFNKKKEPEIIEEKPKKDSGDLLEDDEFSALLAENDDVADKPEKKK